MCRYVRVMWVEESTAIAVPKMANRKVKRIAV